MIKYKLLFLLGLKQANTRPSAVIRLKEYFYDNTTSLWGLQIVHICDKAKANVVDKAKANVNDNAPDEMKTYQEYKAVKLQK